MTRRNLFGGLGALVLSGILAVSAQAFGDKPSKPACCCDGACACKTCDCCGCCGEKGCDCASCACCGESGGCCGK